MHTLAEDLCGEDLFREVVVQHEAYDKYKHAHLVEVRHRPSGVAGECITTLCYYNDARTVISRLVVPGPTKVGVF